MGINGREKHLMMWLLGVFEEPLNVFQMNLLAFPIKIIIFAAKLESWQLLATSHY